LLRLCFESWFGPGKWLPLTAWAAGTLYAGTDELHQLMTDGRSGQWTDVLLDSSGVLTGVALALLILHVVRSSGKERKPENVCP
jgi:VanZ family protein